MDSLRKYLAEVIGTFVLVVFGCGTAAVISPIERLDDPETGKSYNFGKEPGPYSTKLYNALRAIQLGEAEDKHNWNTVMD